MLNVSSANAGTATTTVGKTPLDLVSMMTRSIRKNNKDGQY